MSRLHILMGPMWSGKTNRLIQIVDNAKVDARRTVVVIKHKVDTRDTLSSATTSSSSSTTPAYVKARTDLSVPVDILTSALSNVSIPDIITANKHKDQQQQTTSVESILFAVDEGQFFETEDLLLFWKRIEEMNKRNTLLYHEQQMQRIQSDEQQQKQGKERFSSLSPLLHSPSTLPLHSLVVAGLDLDFKKQPFGGLLQLARQAMEVSSSSSSSITPSTFFVPDSVCIEKLVSRCDYVLNNDPQINDTSLQPHILCGAPAPFSQRLIGTNVGAGRLDQQILVGGAESYAPACVHHHSVEVMDKRRWGGR